MEPLRKKPNDRSIDRAFAPGRLRRQWLATAYERLVPFPRFSRYAESPQSQPQIKEEYLWAR